MQQTKTDQPSQTATPTDELTSPTPKPPAAEKLDIYQRVTDRILESLEAGVKPWVKPWTSGASALPLRSNGQPYQGINTLILWCVADERGYQSPHWVTYKQAQELGGQVRKGEKSAPVVYASKFDKDNAETGKKDSIFFLKSYSVFNSEQCDNLPERFKFTPRDATGPTPERLPEVEAFFLATGAKVQHGGGSACYGILSDTIMMPPIKDFTDAGGYYATLSHECVHWTGHASRLARTLSGDKTTAEYAAEELVAELGSAYLCATLGIAPELEPREDHASYLAFWLRALRSDKRAIFSAAAAAQKAANFLTGKKHEESE